VSDKVKDILHRRSNLKYNGARVQPLPPPSSKPTYGGLSFKRSKHAQAEMKKKVGTNWRNFKTSLGIGLANS
ncbi:hypothetical protein ACJMK2_039210, partial [Sinanodonta woodiana]